MYRFPHIAPLLLCLVLPHAACKGDRGKAPPPGGKASAAAPASKAAAPVDPRAGHHVARSLLAEQSRAELWQGGVFIQLGGPEQNKYTLGNWRTGWGEAGQAAGERYLAAGKRARLRVALASPVTRLVMRARAPGGEQRMTLTVDGEETASAKIGATWAEVTIALKPALPAGHRRLGFKFRRAGVQVAWIWLAEGEGPAPAARGSRVGSLEFGSPRRALLAPSPRRYSYHLVLPADSALVFDYGARATTRFTVRLVQDGADPVVLFRGEGGPKWRTARADLSPHAGKLVRLDFETAAPKPAEAGWGEPDIVRKGPRPAVPLVTAANGARDLIYILIDTVRQDAFKPFNPSTRVHAPALAALATESVRFDNAYNNDNWTKPSVATALSGLYSSTHGTTGKYSMLPREVTLLSEHLRERGFETAGFIANGYVSEKFGFKVGWRTYRNYIREELHYEAKHVFNDALQWLKKPHEGRRFLYIQTIDPHVPYAVPRSFLDRYYPEKYEGPLGPSVSGYETKDWLDGKRQLSEDDKRYIRALYDAEVSYHDHYMGKFIEAIRELGVLDDAVLVVSNDHGEELFDHGKIGHGHSLYDELVRNPLMLRYPRLLPRGERVPDVVGLVDLTPTLLDMLRVPHIKGMDGISLLPTIFGRPPLGESYEVAEFQARGRMVRLGAYKLMFGRDRERLFDLERDPGEQKDILHSHPVARRACEIYLGEALGTPTKSARLAGTPRRRQHRAGDAKMDPQLKRQLEALGYIE